MNTYYVTEHGVTANSPALQTAAIQHVLDLCKEKGGRVVFPRGRFYLSSVRLWSNTTLYLEAGAELHGSDDCNDYEIFAIPAEVEMRSDMELITQYYGTPWEAYRRAIMTAYGEKNIAIIGEAGSIIDGGNCYDPNGEEGYRGPHAIFLSCCEHVHLEGYTAQHSGNFLHEANNCKDLHMRHVTCLGGSDGIHLHCTEHAVIEDCLFKTGDDCIAGINIRDLVVKNCVLNTSCNLFRIGGVGIFVENIYAYGPGYYPHRMTVVQGKGQELPREAGRHNLLSVVDYFASTNYPYVPSDIHFKNCMIENAQRMLYYHANHGPLQSGTHLGTLTLENVHFTDLKEASLPIADEKEPLTIRMKNVTTQFIEEAEQKQLFALSPASHTTLITESNQD